MPKCRTIIDLMGSKCVFFNESKNEAQTAPPNGRFWEVWGPLGNLGRQKLAREAKRRERKGRLTKGDEKGCEEVVSVVLALGEGGRGSPGLNGETLLATS